MRRVVDWLFALLGLILFLPLILLIAILIKIDSPGSALYIPLMRGQHGRVFRLFRFRTMDLKSATLPAEQRLTRLGKFLRNYSLDHLPMLINLLRGDLTLIGPRPMEVGSVDMQNPLWARYFEVKPGLFNYAVLKLGKLWSPMNLNHPEISRGLELEYLQKRSTILDVMLFVHSIKAFLNSRGNIKARGETDPETGKEIGKDLH